MKDPFFFLREAKSSMDGREQPDLATLETLLGHRFRERAMLLRALTHASLRQELDEGVQDNEVLEFLGDAVLGMIISDYLVRHFPQRREGDLSKMRAKVVCSRSLSECAARLGLGSYICMSLGEERGGGRKKRSILADLFEAIVAAIYLDGGIDAARGFVLKHLGEAMEHPLAKGGSAQDYKTLLQMEALKRLGILPVYQLIREVGPPHDKRFFVQVKLDDGTLSRGWGTSKKRAEQEAARRCWQKFAQNSEEADSHREP